MAGSGELRAFSKDLTAAGSGIASEVLPALQVGAGKIKTQLRREMGASKSFKGVTRSIDYSIKRSAGAIEAETGPRSDAGSAGNLANIAYFGGSRGGGTVPDPKGALDAEQPHFEKALGDIIDGLLK